jgi:hypothetical protein
MSEVKARWEQFARKAIELEGGSPRISEVAQAYVDYLRSLPPEARELWLVTPTYAPGRMRTTVVPRSLVPAYLRRFPEVRKRYRDLAEAYFKAHGSASARPGKALEGKMRVLVCEPSFEPATQYGSAFIRHFVAEPYRKKGYDVDTLWRISDLRAPFASSTVRNEVIIGVGHGSETEFTGQFLRKLWEADQLDRREIEGKSVKLLSCLIGAGLGPKLVENGAKIFQGYAKEYLLYMRYRRYFAAPWNDPVAGLFLRAYCNGVSRLLDGGTNLEAYELEQQQLMANAEQVRPSDPEVASALLHDTDHLVMLGDANATIGG